MSVLFLVTLVFPPWVAGHFYEQDEYEMAALEKDEAPLCRTQLDGQGEVAAPKDGAPIAFFSSQVQPLIRE